MLCCFQVHRLPSLQGPSRPSRRGSKTSAQRHSYAARLRAHPQAFTSHAGAPDFGPDGAATSTITMSSAPDSTGDSEAIVAFDVLSLSGATTPCGKPDASPRGADAPLSARAGGGDNSGAGGYDSPDPARSPHAFPIAITPSTMEPTPLAGAPPHTRATDAEMSSHYSSLMALSTSISQRSLGSLRGHPIHLPTDEATPPLAGMKGYSSDRKSVASGGAGPSSASLQGAVPFPSPEKPTAYIMASRILMTEQLQVRVQAASHRGD